MVVTLPTTSKKKNIIATLADPELLTDPGLAQSLGEGAQPREKNCSPSRNPRLAGGGGRGECKARQHFFLILFFFWCFGGDFCLDIYILLP